MLIDIVANAPEMEAKSKTKSLLTTSSYSWSDVQTTAWPVYQYQPSPSADAFVPSFGVLTEADRKSSKKEKGKKQKTKAKKSKQSKGNSKGANLDSSKENKPEPFVPSFGVLTEADRKPAQNKPAETPKGPAIDDDLDLDVIG